MSKYRNNVYEDVKEYFKENIGDEVTNEQIDKMPAHDVLDYYLQWNGIIGWTSDIVSIMEANDDLFSKQDVMTGIKDYVGILTMDANNEQDDKCKTILNNVILSLNGLVENFNE